MYSKMWAVRIIKMNPEKDPIECIAVAVVHPVQQPHQYKNEIGNAREG